MGEMGSQLKGVVIRALTTTDEPFLWAMLYQAIYVPKGQPPPPREIIYERPLSCYVKNWGQREGDCGFLAAVDGQPVGAVWLRVAQGNCHGYGYVDDETPDNFLRATAIGHLWRQKPSWITVYHNENYPSCLLLPITDGNIIGTYMSGGNLMFGA